MKSEDTYFDIYPMFDIMTLTYIKRFLAWPFMLWRSVFTEIGEILCLGIGETIQGTYLVIVLEA